MVVSLLYKLLTVYILVLSLLTESIKGEAKIQDFPLNFFCVSSDVANSEMVIHTTGTAWKYVRASMSLAGYLPPIADENRLLADGGYMK